MVKQHFDSYTHGIKMMLWWHYQ